MWLVWCRSARTERDRVLIEEQPLLPGFPAELLIRHLCGMTATRSAKQQSPYCKLTGLSLKSSRDLLGNWRISG